MLQIRRGNRDNFKLSCTKVQRSIVVTLTSASALASHVLRRFFMLLARHYQASYPYEDRSCPYFCLKTHIVTTH